MHVFVPLDLTESFFVLLAPPQIEVNDISYLFTQETHETIEDQRPFYLAFGVDVALTNTTLLFT